MNIHIIYIYTSFEFSGHVYKVAFCSAKAAVQQKERLTDVCIGRRQKLASATNRLAERQQWSCSVHWTQKARTSSAWTIRPLTLASWNSSSQAPFWPSVLRFAKIQTANLPLVIATLRRRWSWQGDRQWQAVQLAVLKSLMQVVGPLLAPDLACRSKNTWTKDLKPELKLLTPTKPTLPSWSLLRTAEKMMTSCSRPCIYREKAILFEWATLIEKT